ncbi:SIS domain-containing protein [Mediterraneibacter massiliensis]|jgi:fructoselysine-6-P-deglycase FrlB-like protein|uniref:SIS domain-containing protein n=1 Tax=Mediterraneibacter massiliensis TaxID=1720300 RepID=UPI000E4B9624|nr:SIS domain-containing protein [Mediterraneibacter massiliensis]RGT71015.1 SIS domain-containing protein [Ruminococcus sp. AF18-22]
MEIRELIEKIVKEKEAVGGIKNVMWIAAGGSHDGHYAAQYFMDRESTVVASQQITSSEFVYAPPKCVGTNTIAVVTSMRGTRETIEAAKVAKALGAVTISQYVDESELTEVCDYNVQYGSIWEDDKDQGKTNAGNALRIAMAIVDIVEGYEHYAEAMDAFTKVQSAYVKAREYCRPLAEKWAEQMKDEKIITVLASGPAYGSGRIFSTCNILEMLQIHSPTFNSCDFFHGPLEITDKNQAFFLLVADGRTRKADERAVTFMNKYAGDKVYILDAKEIGIDKLKDSVSEYFTHILFTPILNNVYMKALSKATGMDYTTRRYMWKVEY